MSRRDAGIMPPSDAVAPPVAETAETTAPAVPAAGFWRSHGPTLAAQNYDLVPLRRGTKIPAKPGWRNDTYKTTDKALLRGFHGCGVGVKTGKLVAIDIDCDDPHVVEQYVSWCKQQFGPGLRRDGSRGTMLFYWTSEPGQKVTSHAYTAPGHEKPQRLEVLGIGQQAGVYVERPDSRQPYYTYPDGELTDTPLDELAEISKAQRHAAVDSFDNLARAAGWAQIALASKGGGEHKPGKHQQAPLWRLEAMLAVLPPKYADNYDLWIKVGAILHCATGGAAAGLQLWDEWSRQSDKYDGDTDKKWESFASDRHDRAGAGTLAMWANEFDSSWLQRAREARAAALIAARTPTHFQFGGNTFYMDDVAERLRRARGAAR